MNNDFKFSDAERVSFAKISMQNEAIRLDHEDRKRSEADAGRAQIDAIVAANREAMAEAREKEREEMFLAEARLKFFESNPNASESDFKRLLPKLQDEILLGNFRDSMQPDKPEFWDAAMN